MTPVRQAPDELREFLAAFAPGISKLFFATRRVVLTAAPEANELIYDANNAVTAAYSFSERLKEAFCHVAAYSGHVNLGFNRGTDLPLSEDTARPSSFHNGGVHFAFCDTHVAFVDETIDYKVYMQLMTPEGAGSDMPAAWKNYVLDDGDY